MNNDFNNQIDSMIKSARNAGFNTAILEVIKILDSGAEIFDKGKLMDRVSALLKDYDDNLTANN